MAGLQLSVKTEFTGTFWDKSATDAIMADYQRDVLDDLALSTGVAVVAEMQATYIAPRPYYWTTVEVEHTGPTSRKVTDNASVVYNFWLEGLGSRNFPVTSFRGYGIWQHQRRLAQRRVPAALRRHLPATLARLNA